MYCANERASAICRVVKLLLEYMPSYHIGLDPNMLYAYVSIAAPNKHKYLRRFNGVAEMRIPMRAPCYQGQGCVMCEMGDD